MDILSIFLDIHIFTTIPVQILLIIVLLKNSKFDQVYEACLLNVLICDLSVCLVELLIKESSQWGLVFSFLLPLTPIFAKISFIALFTLTCGTSVWNFLLALSRIFMLITKQKFKLIWNEKVTYLFVAATWAWKAGIAVYIVFGCPTQYYLEANNYSISYQTVEPDVFLLTYATQLVPIFVITTIGIYFFFFILLTIQNFVSKNETLKARVVRTVVAAMLQNFAALISSFPSFYETIRYEFPSFHMESIDLPTYLFCLKVGTNLYATSSAWIMVFCVKEYRTAVMDLILRRDLKRNNNTTLTAIKSRRSLTVSRIRASNRIASIT